MEIPSTPGSLLSPTDMRLLQCRVPRYSWWRGSWACTPSRHIGTGTYGRPCGSAQRTMSQQQYPRKHTHHSTNANSTEVSPVPPLQLLGVKSTGGVCTHIVWVSPVAILRQSLALGSVSPLGWQPLTPVAGSETFPTHQPVQPHVCWLSHSQT